MKKAPTILSKGNKVALLRRDENGKRPLGLYQKRFGINFGDRSQNAVEKLKRMDVVLNHPSCLKIASDKVLTKKRLIDVGLPTPAMQTCTNWQELNLPIVFKRKSGSGGQGMYVAKTDEEGSSIIQLLSEQHLLNQYFVEEVFQADLRKNYEFRISVAAQLEPGWDEENIYKSGFGEIVTLRKRMKKDAVDNDSFGRNIALGNSYFEKVDFSKLSEKWTERIKEGVEIAQNAIKALEMDFGAFDMIFDSVSKSWTILEVNSAPSLGTDFTLGCWVKALKYILQKLS